MPKSKLSQQDKLKLIVEPRTIFGKKLKKLRKAGKIPANIFGQGYKSKSVSVDFKDFVKVFKVARETGVVFLQDGKEHLPILIKNVQRQPVDDTILHVDFRKIDLTQKIQTEVPVKVTGQSEAVAQKGGVLLTLAETVLLEALPTDIPSQIEIDITVLKEVGQDIKVADIPKSAKYAIMEDPNKVLVSVVEHKEEEVLPQTTPTATPEILTAKPEEGIVPEEKPGQPQAGKTPEAKPAPAEAAKKEDKSPKK